MFDGLIDILMGWLSQAFCWILQHLVLLAVSLMHIIAAVLPSVALPDWLSAYSSPFLAVASTVAWLFPTYVLAWMFASWIMFELGSFLLLIFYRAFMDLL